MIVFKNYFYTFIITHKWGCIYLEKVGLKKLFFYHDLKSKQPYCKILI
mgnify:CR=1 FL=1|jgi:hypothetical protein